MKKAIIFTTNLASLLLILNSMNVVDALALFVIAGRIPGTEWYLSAEFMTLITAGTIGYFAGRLTTRILLYIEDIRSRMTTTGA